MTPAILAESERRERLRCVVCGAPPPEQIVQGWPQAETRVCGECNGAEPLPVTLRRFTWNSTLDLSLTDEPCSAPSPD